MTPIKRCKIMVEKKEYKIPYIEDKYLYLAVKFAIFLIEKKDLSLSYALQITCSKKNYKVKSHIEKYVRMYFDKDFFLERAKKKTPLSLRRELATRARYQNDFDSKIRNHMFDISQSN